MELLRTTTGRILVESHRGCQDVAPENSWLALETGRQMGADLLEVDVQLSQDGTAFLRHNYTLPDGRWCHAVPWSELQTLMVKGHPFPL
jgi:glycerophosphoryl diester phosphodiesterase